MMYAAFGLACAAFSPQGWEMRELQEAGLSLYLPAEPVLSQVGPDPATPQSVERFVWVSRGMGITATVSYERWKSPHFAPEASLDLLARRQFGLQKGFTLQPATLGGHMGSILMVQDTKGVTRAVSRAKSGNESWQVDLKPDTGTLDEETLQGLQESVAISAAPEQEGLYSTWGTLNAQIQPPPQPRPLPEKPITLAGAHLSLKSPIALIPRSRPNVPGTESIFASINEWAGREEGIDIALSFFQIKPSQALDLGGWVGAYGTSLEKEGFKNISPDVEQVKLGSLSGRRIFATADSPSGPLKIQVILLTEGQKCWALQMRTPLGTAYAQMHEAVFKSIKPIPSAG